jgi:peptide/nickel transport system permease protein
MHFEEAMPSAARHAIRMLLLLLLGSLLGAALVRMAPGFGVPEEDLDSRLNRESHTALDQQPPEDTSLMRFYFHYCGRLLHGDLGTSAVFHEPVRQLLAERIPETAKTLAIGMALAWTLGLGAALVSLLPRWHWIKGSASFFCSLILCIPTAVLAIFFFLAQAPVRIAVGIVVLPRVYSFARGLLDRTAELPHVIAARARGVGELSILVRHVARVAAPQLLALCGVSVCTALAACVPMEALCDSPGIGQLAWQAALSRDLPLLVTLTMIVTFVTLSANLAAEAVGEAAFREGPR